MLISMKTQYTSSNSPHTELIQLRESALAEVKMRDLLQNGLNSSIGLSLGDAVKKLRERQFNQIYGEWITEQNKLVERYGIFGEEFRTW
jgi:hypothetical protein